jgi:DNA-binding NarL/FixJ family response regulator
MKEMPKTRFVIADDHIMLASALADALVIAAPALTKQNLFDSLIQLKTWLGSLQPHNLPDLLILDIHMPPADGLDFATDIKKDYPQIKILMLTMFQGASIINRIRLAGIEGYIHKGTSLGQFVEAIRTILARGQSFPASNSNEELAKGSGNGNAVSNGNANGNGIGYRETQAPLSSPLSALTASEAEVTRALSLGLSTKDIAVRLGRSEHTISTHRRNILAKLKLESTAQLIRMATQVGW